MNLNDAELMQRIHNDLIDSYDEEFELELEERALEDSAKAANSENSILPPVSVEQAAKDKEYRRIWSLGNILRCKRRCDRNE